MLDQSELNQNAATRDRKPRKGKRTTTPSKAFTGTWVATSVTEYDHLLVWYQDHHGVYHNSRTGEIYDAETGTLDNPRELISQELSRKEQQLLLKEIHTLVLESQPNFLDDVFVNVKTLETYNPETKTLSHMDNPSVGKVLSQEDHRKMMREIYIDIGLTDYKEKSAPINSTGMEVSNDFANMDLYYEVPELLKPLELGTKMSIFLAHLKPGEESTKVAVLLEPRLAVQLNHVITCLELGKFGVRWLTLNNAQKLVVTARIAMALRIAGNYMLKDQKLSLSAHGEDIFNPHQDDIKDFFDHEDASEYLIIHGSFIFGPASEQPGDIDLIIPMLDASKAEKEVNYALVIGDLQSITPSTFASTYRVNDLHPSKYGSEMDAYLGIVLWGNTAIGSSIFEEWKKIQPDFRKLSEKVLDKGRNDSQSKRTRKLVELAVICHHFLQWMNIDFGLEHFNEDFSRHLTCLNALIEKGNGTLIKGSYVLNGSELVNRLKDVMSCSAYINKVLRILEAEYERRVKEDK